MSFNGRFVVNLAQFVEQKGGDRSHMLGFTGLSEEELCSEDCTLTNEVYNQVIEQAVILAKDPFFGLHAGENLNLSAAGLIGQITHNCESVRQALQMCCDFANLGCSVLPMSMVDSGNHVLVQINPDPEWRKMSFDAFRHTLEGVLAFTIREYQSLTNGQNWPVEIHLPYSLEIMDSEFQRVFGCPVMYDSEIPTIVFTQQQVNTAILTSDYTLLRILVSHAEKRNQELAQKMDFLSLVKKSVLKLVKPEFPTVDMVAAHLNISARTLQRRLNEDGTNFQTVINLLRYEMACEYLERGDLSVKEVSYLLDYGEPSTFIRFFKKHAGMTPRMYMGKFID